MSAVPETGESEQNDANGRKSDMSGAGGRSENEEYDRRRVGQRHEIERGDKQTDPGGAPPEAKAERRGRRRDEIARRGNAREAGAVDDFGVGGVGEAGNELAWRTPVERARERRRGNRRAGRKRDINSARFVRMGERIKMKAPKVPLRLGKGTKRDKCTNMR